MRRLLLSLGLASLSLVSTATALPQSNGDPAIDVELTVVNRLRMLGRMGSYPDGRNGLSFATTICNVGSVPLDWYAAMNTRHPFIAFLVTRQSDGRMVQISDRSYVKHGIAAANASLCGSCTQPPGPLGSLLGIGCSDTYDVSTNGDRFGLGPADEIDPWLGAWTRQCSHFDRGEPAVAPPNDCDNARSLTNAQVNAFNNVTHRVEVDDAELDTAGTFYYQAAYIVAGALESVRGDDLGSRRFTPTWNGNGWNFANTGGLVLGSVLERWSGASVSSNTNGADDGRVYVAVQVTGPVEGRYHYEYALHNRDNGRGVAELSIPLCPSARVFNVGFRDIDGDAGTDWTSTLEGGELRFSTTSNPLRWNSVYNFWFDSDAAPLTGDVDLEAFDAGPGSPSFAVTTSVPMGSFNQFTGSGCAPTTPPTLYAEGSPAQAQLGNGTFALASSGHAPGTRTVLVVGTGAPASSSSGCPLLAGPNAAVFSVASADANGKVVHPLPIPNSPSLEGIELNAQCLSIRARPRPLGQLTLSDGLRVRVGNSLAGCP